MAINPGKKLPFPTTDVQMVEYQKKKKAGTYVFRGLKEGWFDVVPDVAAKKEPEPQFVDVITDKGLPASFPTDQPLPSGYKLAPTAPTDDIAATYGNEWATQVARGLDPNWVRKNVNPQTGKSYSEEKREAQAVVERKEEPVTPKDPGVGTLPDLPYEEPTTPLAPIEEDGEETPEVAQGQDSTEANELANKILAGIGEDAEVDTRESTSLIDALEEIEEALPDLPEEPKSLVDLFNAEKAKLGIEPLETELADIDANIQRIQGALLVEAEEAGEKLLSVAEIGREKGALQKRADREIALLNIERNVVATKLGNKLSTLETVMGLTQSDFSNASAYYTQSFNRSIQLINIIEGYKTKEDQEANRVRDDARANLTVITNLFKNSTSDWADIADSTQLKIESLEAQAGFPVVITEAFLDQNPKADVISTTSSYDAQGNQQVTFIYADENGKPGVVEVVKTGGVKAPTAAELAAKGLIWENTQTGEQFDLTTVAGLKRAGELGITEADARVALEKHGLNAGTIDSLIEGAGVKPAKKEGRTPEITDEVIRAEVRTEKRDGRTAPEIRDLVTKDLNLTDADKERYYLIIGELMPEEKEEEKKEPGFIEKAKGFFGL